MMTKLQTNKHESRVSNLRFLGQLPHRASGNVCCRNPHSLATLAFFAIAGVVYSTSIAEDVVRYSSAGRRGETKLTGVVLDYTGRELRLRLPNGREQALDAARVLEVVTSWGPSVQEGDKQFAAGEYRQAAVAYGAGLQTESRVWARRRILSQLVWCSRYDGQTRAAIETFLAMYKSDSTTHYFASIPLSWSTAQPDSLLRAQLKKWLSDGVPVARLIAASWLLSTADRGDALATLQALDDPDPRIAFLAQAQLWRIQVGRPTAEDADQWQQRITQMPGEIRAGPYFTVGRAWSQLGKPEEAALAFLRVPILFRKERHLSPQALFAAGQQLERLQQPLSARPLYQEIVRDYPRSGVADQARQRLTVLQTLK